MFKQLKSLLTKGVFTFSDKAALYSLKVDVPACPSSRMSRRVISISYSRALQEQRYHRSVAVAKATSLIFRSIVGQNKMFDKSMPAFGVSPPSDER